MSNQIYTIPETMIFPITIVQHDKAPMRTNIQRLERFLAQFKEVSDIVDRHALKEQNLHNEAISKVDAVNWIKSELTVGKPWQIMADRDIYKMNRSDAGLVLLLNETNALLGLADNEVEMLHLDRLLSSMQNLIIRNASRELCTYENSRENTKGARPSDIFRHWALPLRWIKSKGNQIAGDILRDLELEITMPIGELETPEWIDSMTGALDPTYSPLEKKLAAEVKDGVEASPNESFDAEEEVFEGELEDSRSDWTAPVWAQAQQDGLPDDDLQDLQNEFLPLAQRLSKEIDKQIKLVRKLNVSVVFGLMSDMLPALSDVEICRVAENVLDFPKMPWQYLSDASGSVWFSMNKQKKQIVKELRSETFEAVHQGILESETVTAIMEFLSDKAKTENPANVASIFLGVNHVYGLEDEAAAEIALSGQYSDLASWLEDYGDNLVEMISNKSYWVRKETTRADIEAFSERTIQMMSKQFGDPKSQKIDARPEWIAGYLTAFSNGAKSSQEAIKSAWESWRSETNLEANAAYHQAEAVGASPKDAMKAFWSVANKGASRPTEKIVDIKKSGLTLASGRVVDYHIAALKFKGKELDLDASGIDRLLAILNSRGWGIELINVIG